jgi:hypothetical protein
MGWVLMADAVPAVPIMSKAKARRLIDRIKTDAEHLWTLILEAHDGRAWKALGYSSWAECAKTEFGESRSNSYRLLAQARLMGELEAAAPTPEVSRARDRLSQRDVERMAPETKAELVEEFAAAETAEDAEAAVDRAKEAQKAKEPPPPKKATRNFEPDPITVNLTGEALIRLVDLAVAEGVTREAMATKILRTVLETGEVLTTNGHVAKRQPVKVGAPAGGSAIHRAKQAQASKGNPNLASDGSHTHVVTTLKGSASGMPKCGRCPATKVGERWVEP